MGLGVSTVMKCVLTHSNGNDACKNKNINPELAPGISFIFKIIIENSTIILQERLYQ